MFFAYVYTAAGENVSGDSIPISLSPFDKIGFENKNLTVIRQIVEGEGIDFDTVTRIEVETGLDCDEDGNPDSDNPDTIVCYTLGGI